MSFGIGSMRAVPRLICGGSPADSIRLSPSAGLTPGDVKSLLRRTYRLENPFSNSNSVTQHTIARAFGANVIDELLYEARSLLVAQTKIRGGYFDHDLFSRFGRSGGTKLLPPQETLDRIISEACRRAGVTVERQVREGTKWQLLPQELYPVFENVKTNTRATINDTLDELVGELYYLSMLCQYFFTTPFEGIGVTISKLELQMESVERQLSWHQGLSLGLGVDANDLKKAYGMTQALRDAISFWLNLGVSQKWSQVHDLREYSAAKERISSFVTDHVDELLDFLLKYWVSQDHLIKDLCLQRNLDSRELQALKMARDSGPALAGS